MEIPCDSIQVTGCDQAGKTLLTGNCLRLKSQGVTRMTDRDRHKTLMESGGDDPEPTDAKVTKPFREKKPRQNVTIRVRTELREKLEERARLNGRSMSEEIEMFIELGFAEQSRKDELWSSDIRRHFEKDLEELWKQRSDIIVERVHDKNMNEMRKMFFMMMERMSDMQKIFANESALQLSTKSNLKE